jgi:TRAP-type C4-dicarboxylate transport system permease small subunit
MRADWCMKGGNMRFLDMCNVVINKFLLILGGISVIALMLLATGNVILRIFHAPFEGTYEIVSFLGAITIAFALGFTQKTKSNIVVDILSGRFPVSLVNTIDKAVHQCIAVFFAMVTWRVYAYGMKIYESHEMSETLRIIYYPFIFAVAVGFAALSFTGFVDFLKALFGEEESK